MSEPRRTAPMFAVGLEDLTAREHLVLEALDGIEAVLPGRKGWTTPMWIGGRDQSHHSRTLAKLVRYGLAERRERAGWTKTSWLYRISKRGRALLKRRS